MTTRRDLLLSGAAALPALAFGRAAFGDPFAAAASTEASAADAACERPARGPNAGWLPNVPVLAHDGRRALFYDDLIAGRRVIVHCFALVDPGHAAVLDNLAAVAARLGPALGREVFFYSLALDAAPGTPRALADEARRRALPDGWWLLTGEPPDVGLLRARLYAFAGGRAEAGADPHAAHHAAPEHAVHGASPVDPAVPGPAGQDCSLGLLRYGNEAAGLWGAVPARTDPEWIARRLAWVAPRPPPAGAPRRRGPHPETYRSLALAVALGAAVAAAAASPAAAQPAAVQDPAAQDPAAVAAAVAARQAREVPLYAHPPEATPGTACPYSGTPVNPQYPGICHPYPQPRPQPSTQTTTGCPDDCFTDVKTGAGIFPPSNPYDHRTFPGNNLLPTIYTNLFDGLGNEVPNTLPSTPDRPYNLHAATPVVTAIDPASPEDDLDAIFRRLLAAGGEGGESGERDGDGIAAAIRVGLDILEGERVEGRAYSGFPLLHFNGPEKTKVVEPILDAAGHVIGGNVDVHQIMYGGRIESDTAFLDPSAVEDVPWTITYTVDVLSRGMDDFSPFVMYLDDPAASPSGKPAMPLAGMDQTFFAMEDGTRTVLPIAMAPGKYFKLVYAWGWRQHPPRVQVMENAELSNGVHYPPAGGTIEEKAAANPACPMEYDGLTLPQVEEAVFGKPPLTLCRERGAERALCEENRRRAIARIGDVAPAKRMWLALRDAAEAAERGDRRAVAAIVAERAQPAFYAWRERTRLPCYQLDREGGCVDGVEPDPGSDITLLYVNNTTYGELTAGGWVKWLDWETRFTEWQRLDAEWQVAFERWQRTGEGGRPWRPPGPPVLDVTILNGDDYVHAYVNVDFGGNRGWENQFKSSVRVAGSGCWFTFGRNYWWINAGAGYGFICVPEADGETLGRHKVKITYEYEPSRRLRFYQFDPFHHDVAVYSIH